MHPNKIFHDRPEAENRAFAADRAFGTLAVSAPAGPLLAHVPFLLGGDLAEMHLVRSNPIVALLDEPRPAVLATTGPDGYVSPDWYGIDDQVPTWNYVAVHLRGRLERRPDHELRSLLRRQSAAYEARLAPKRPWTLDKMTDAALDRLLRMIVPCRLHVEAVDGTWKLSQNKPDAARLAAADAMPAGFGREIAALAGLMRDLA